MKSIEEMLSALSQRKMLRVSKTIAGNVEGSLYYEGSGVIMTAAISGPANTGIAKLKVDGVEIGSVNIGTATSGTYLALNSNVSGSIVSPTTEDKGKSPYLGIPFSKSVEFHKAADTATTGAIVSVVLNVQA